MRFVAGIVGLLLLAAAAAPGAAQGSGVLMGIVTDTAGSPVFAIVQIDASADAAFSRHGSYSIQHAAGEYVLTVEAFGFERHRSPRLHISEGDTTVYHVELVRAPPLPGTIWRGCALGSLPMGSVCLNPDRVDAQALRVEEVGEWVFRTESEWETFWRQYLPAQHPGHLPAPEIDWENNYLVAVGRGGVSGCSNWRRYVNRVTLYRDRTVVSLGPEFRGGEITCPMLTQPVDAVVLPRGYGPVVFEEVEQAG
jgi:hypothetical protein